MLALSRLVPMAEGSGGQRREFHLLRRLAELGHDVTVVCAIPRYELDAVADAQRVGLRITGGVRPASLAREMADALLAQPALAARAATDPREPWALEVLWRSMAAATHTELGHDPDVVMVCGDVAAAWRRHLPRRMPAVLELHDVTSDLVGARAHVGTGATGLALTAEAARLRAHAHRWLPRFDRLVCVSERDAQIAAGLSGRPTDVVPNGVDTAAFAVTPEPDGPPTVLFTGTLNYLPNAEGAVWLAAEVWPLVRRALPDARLRIVGRRPTADLAAFDGTDGIEVPGGVPDMAPYFRSAHVAAIAIHAGGGTRLKVAEAAACGRAMVSTTLGADGTGLRDGRELVLADDPAAFAAALVDLLGDPARRRELAVAARAVVERDNDWNALGERLGAALERAVAR